MTVAEMLQVQREDVVTNHDLALAELIELSETNLRELSFTEVHYLGNITLLGEPDHPVIRTHCGPEGTTKRGGTKFKAYHSVDEWYQDGLDHGKEMRDKIGLINEVSYGGGKTIADIDPAPEHLTRAEQDERVIEALDQLAGLVVEAGLDDPRKDGTAGDQGTNGHIGTAYRRGLERRGVPHAEACVTGKPDMRTRPAATGRGAAISKRQSLREQGETEGTIVTQGAGFAGAYYAAEAYEPYDEADRDVRLHSAAIGDIDRKKRPVTLFTEDPAGLPITYEMVDAILLDPHDRHVRATEGDKLAALALKLQEDGARVEMRQQDVLTFDPGTRRRGKTSLAPAATSNVFRWGNIGGVVIKDIDAIGNHVVDETPDPRTGESLADCMEQLGFNVTPGQIRNVGGVKISIEENRRDLNKIAAEEAGVQYVPVTDHEYQNRLRDTMVAVTSQAHRVAEHFNVTLTDAVKLISLGSYAVAYGMHVSQDMRNLLLAA